MQNETLQNLMLHTILLSREKADNKVKELRIKSEY